MEDSRLSNGTFKKCDMHIHSSSCYSRSYSEKKFIEKMSKSDLDVFAVTDHNIVDTKLISSLKNEVNGKIIFGGAEINFQLKEETIAAYNLTVNSDCSYFHAIVLFGLEYADNVSNILTDLFISKIQEGNDSNLSEENLKKENDSNLSEENLKKENKKSFSKLTKGRAIYLEDFQERISAIPYLFIPHENKGSRNLSQYLPNEKNGKKLKNNEDYKDKLFYYSHAMAVEGGEKSRKTISDGLATELNTTITSLLFSDAKELDQIGKKYTWIDFDGDLDSLLLAISDPESRIKTSDISPNLPQTNTLNFLEEVTFSSYSKDDNEHKNKLLFSPGFNGIVGSRGSGKTLLARLLAKKDLDQYSEYVDKNSVMFRTHDGVPTTDNPPCLYLGQGELEGIYTDGNYYEKITFLDELIKPLIREKKKTSIEVIKKLKEVLNLENRMLKAFSKKYESGLKHMDHFDTGIPSGVSLDKPVNPARLKDGINKTRDKIEEISSSICELSTKGKMESLSSAFPEDEELVRNINNEIQEIDISILELSEKVKRLLSELYSVDCLWFERRNQLVDLYFSLLEDYNKSNGSSMHSSYIQKSEELKVFFDELLELRILLSRLDAEADNQFKKLLEPTNPYTANNNEDIIEVSLIPENETTFSKIKETLFSGKYKDELQPLVVAFAHKNDSSMHAVFNGLRFKNCQKNNLNQYYEKYFSLLSKEFEDVGELKTCIKVNKKKIDDMSPGTKAETLLKLFLNDKISSGQWVYVVLDQPEDNLDVATIKDFLIDRIKKLKLNVQIFAVSHSAPIIVNGDARSVVVCENTDDEISYKSGALNDNDIKQSIVDVLDGGERYLKMRLNKYNFQIGDKND